MEIIQIDENLRLVPYVDGMDTSFAIDWYSDPDDLLLIDGFFEEPYDRNRIERMYKYLSERGEVYFIEECKDEWKKIGDVTFYMKDMPIFIIKERRNKGIGTKVVKKLLEIAKERGYSYLSIREIYSFNIPSIALFTSLGFQKDHPTQKGWSYIIHFDEIKDRHAGGEGILSRKL